MAAGDLDPVSGRARLSYRRAEEIFNELTKPLAHPAITDSAEFAAAPGWTLHDLRHSALTHAAENGANTGTLLAYSGHASVASLSRYTRVSQVDSEQQGVDAKACLGFLDDDLAVVMGAAQDRAQPPAGFLHHLPESVTGTTFADLGTLIVLVR